MAKVLRDHINDLARYFTAPAGSAETKTAPAMELKASEAQRVAFSYIAGIEQYPPRAYTTLTKYARENPIVRRALKLCGEGVASLEPILKVGGQEIDLETAPKELLPIVRYLKKPNPAQGGAQLIAQLAMFYKASGNGWLEFVPGMPGYAEFYALRPERMNIVPSDDGWPREYRYDPKNGRKKVWPVDIQRGKSSILHIKDLALDDDLYGHGALEAADKALAVWESAWVLARAMFENGAVPAGALVYSPKVPAGSTYPVLGKEQRNDLQEQLEKKFKGAKNRGKPMVMGDDLRWEPMSQSMVDMEAIALRESASRDIANAFGVPPMLLGVPGDNTYSNFQEASRGFFRNTVFYDANMIWSAIGSWWSQLAGIRDLEITYDEEKAWALADELSQKWARVESAQSLSFQEKREAIGYDREPDPADLFQSPMGGFATIEEMVNSDYGLFGPGGGASTVVGNEPIQDEPASGGRSAQLPKPKE